MNQFKRDLNYELRTVSLSEEKKQQIAAKVKAKKSSRKWRINWQYGFVLTAFTILSLSFGYLLLQQGESAGKLQGAAPIEPRATPIWLMLNNDYLKMFLFIGIFVILRTIIRKRLQRNGKGLPVCVECGEEWSFWEALKQSMKNSKVTCPHCSHKQYRTKKSAMNAALLNIPIPFMTLVHLLFDNTLFAFFGIVVYLSCVAFFIVSLIPYLVDLQEKDPINESLY